MWHYVYKIDRETTGEYYIGIRSCDVKPLTDNYMGSGRLLREKLKADPLSFNKTILVIVASRKEAARIEKELVGPAQVADKKCLNLCEGGGRGCVGIRLSPARLRRMSAVMKDVLKTADHRASISAALKGKMTPEHRAKIVAANRRRTGKKHSEEAKAKISSALRGNTNSRKKSREV